jgi:anti-anti-sigma factor
MQISVTNLDDDLVHVALIGRMDAMGVEIISIPFTAATASRKARVAVDLALVDFLASAGLRQFFANARTQQQRGGRLVLAAPQPDVSAVLDATGVRQLIPIYTSLEEALLALRAGAADTL